MRPFLVFVRRLNTDFILLPLTQTVHSDKKYIDHLPSDIAKDDIPTYQPLLFADYEAADVNFTSKVKLCRQRSRRDRDSGRRDGENYVKVI